MNVSIVIAAYNAAAMIQETLDAVLAQTHGGWEAIVVDDGSTDHTRAIVEAAARAEPRIRLVSRPHGGGGAARNAGIAAARFDWLLFLDADDLIHAAHLERMTAELVRGPRLDAICCQAAVLFTDGETAGGRGVRQTGDLFELLGHSRALDNPTCILRRSLALAIGGFDESLGTAQDWDFWIRLARTGARFGWISDALATCGSWRVPRSATGPESGRDEILERFESALRVTDRTYGPDSRMPAHLDAHPQGLPPTDHVTTKLALACWAAGLMIGSGRDACTLLDRIDGTGVTTLDGQTVADGLFRGVLGSTGQRPDVWLERWPALGPRVNRFLAALDARAGVAQGLGIRGRDSLAFERCATHFGHGPLARRASRALERLIADQARWNAPVGIGETHCVQLEATEPISDVELFPGAERLHCRVTVEGRPLGALLLPGIARRVRADVIADAIADRFGWALAGRFLEATAYRDVEVRRDDDGASLIRNGTVLMRHPGRECRSPGSDAFHDAVGWPVFLQELWDRPAWPASAFYDPDFGEERPVAPARVRASGSRIEIEVGGRVPDVETRHDTLEVLVKVGGVPLGIAPVRPTGEWVRAQQIRAAVTTHAGYELLRAAVQYAVLGRQLGDGTTFAERLEARAAAAALTGADRTATESRGRNGSGPGDFGAQVGVAFARREPAVFGRSASRRAALPASAADTLLEVAAAFGDAVVRQPVRSPSTEEILYQPELIPASHVGGGPAAVAPLQQPAGVRDRIDRLAGRARYRRVKREDSWAALGAMTDRLPILMYHRVAPSGAPALENHRVTPDRFKEQLDYLDEAGFQSVSLAEWGEAIRSRTPLPGRRVLITFDDGYRDFAEFAWPLLRRHGFQAMVFLVADRVGTTNRWDEDFGETVPLLGWDEVRRLQREGVELGSHTATHPHLTALAVEDVVREAARSRAVLRRELGSEVIALSYPYSDHDPVVTHLAGACGYTYGLSAGDVASRFTDDPLALPRLSVRGSDGLTEFAEKLEPLWLRAGADGEGRS